MLRVSDLPKFTIDGIKRRSLRLFQGKVAMPWEGNIKLREGFGLEDVRKQLVLKPSTSLESIGFDMEHRVLKVERLIDVVLESPETLSGITFRREGEPSYKSETIHRIAVALWRVADEAENRIEVNHETAMRGLTPGTPEHCQLMPVILRDFIEGKQWADLVAAFLAKTSPRKIPLPDYLNLVVKPAVETVAPLGLQKDRSEARYISDLIFWSLVEKNDIERWGSGRSRVGQEASTLVQQINGIDQTAVQAEIKIMIQWRGEG